MPETATMEFPRTRQGVRNLDRAPADLLPVSGGPAPAATGTANVGETERLASAIGGAFLASYGICRADLAGVGLALAGATLMLRGATGHCQLYQALGFSTARPRGESHREIVYRAR